MVCCVAADAGQASNEAKKQTTNERNIMNKVIAGLIVAGLVMSGAAFSLLAQNGTGRCGNGKGYGGPPQSQEERAARQAACLKKNGGVCPNGGTNANGQGQGKGWRHGACDGTGPRAGTTNCPALRQK